MRLKIAMLLALICVGACKCGEYISLYAVDGDEREALYVGGERANVIVVDEVLTFALVDSDDTGQLYAVDFRYANPRDPAVLELVETATTTLDDTSARDDTYASVTVRGVSVGETTLRVATNDGYEQDIPFVVVGSAEDLTYPEN